MQDKSPGAGSPFVDLLGDGPEPQDPFEPLLKRALWATVNAAQAAFTVGWSALWISAALGVTLVSRSPHKALTMARTIWAPGLLRGAGAKVFVQGGDELDWSAPALFVCNHQSMIDIPTAFVALPCDLRFIAKRELAHIPFLGWYMRATGMVFVERGEGARARQSIRLAGERIRAGASILAFPEGTRSRDGKIHAFKKGAFVVAIEAQVPIVPVAIEGAQRVLPCGGFRVRPGEIRVAIGKPIPTCGLRYEDRDTLIAQVRQALALQHRSIGGLGC
ncbi:MAG: lysophospholipid acyltransferase family protein [Myxococcales bacterium]|nr:1-acyl-sn-glycerol-3-phosphate acyltransferase [Polyangiaceae bacterium]MDW8248373.1 lysophospholipid acyltransferase family protein [Myxococcales bacterium]